MMMCAVILTEGQSPRSFLESNKPCFAIPTYQRDEER
jgi:hypothetical protein